MNNLKALYAKLKAGYAVVPKWLVALVAALAGFLLGRLGAPWLI